MHRREKTQREGNLRPPSLCCCCAGKRLEIAAGTAQDRLMDQGHINAPDRWREALARSEAELARGELVPSQVVHDELRQALAELEAELAEPDESTSPHPTGR